MQQKAEYAFTVSCGGGVRPFIFDPAFFQFTIKLENIEANYYIDFQKRIVQRSYIRGIID